MTREFLTAEWKHLVMLNYAIDPSLLQPFVPAGTEIDAFEGETYVSLVGFEFNRTRVLGFAVPFHRSFEEVNLRFYVRRGDRRGVVFIKELVPKRAVAFVARWIYGENYSCVAMSHRIAPGTAEYAWGTDAARCLIQVETAGEGFLPPDGSLAQFITEHYWGYARARSGCREYEVRHPRWTVASARTAGFSGDATPYYGPAFAKILAREPDSAFLAEGSPVTVFKAAKIAVTG